MPAAATRWRARSPRALINGLLRRFTGVPISDFGCAFNAYRREAIEPLLGSIGKQKFTKALVLASGASVEEVDVSHAARARGSRYSPVRLVRLALHVIAGFWPQPVQWIGVALGLVCTARGCRPRPLRRRLLGRRGKLPRPALRGDGIVFVLGMEGFILALIGEYLGRIQRDVEGRPLYTMSGGAVSKRVLVTGGAGFISSNMIRHLLDATAHEVVSLDALTYAGNLENLADVLAHPRLSFVHGDIRDRRARARARRGVDVIVNAAAESHVEKSIEDGASEFVTHERRRDADPARRDPRDAGRALRARSRPRRCTAPPSYAPMDEEHPLEAALAVRRRRRRAPTGSRTRTSSRTACRS